MATYSVNYRCGHGTYEVYLSGKHTKRYERIDWLEATKVCPDCYKKKMKAQDDNAPKIARLCLNSLREVVICVTGELDNNKDTLRDLGYKWTRELLPGHQQVRYVLSKRTDIPATTQAVHEWAEAEAAALQPLGYSLATTLSPNDAADLRRVFALRKELAKVRAATQETMASIKAADPRPGPSSLAKRIAKLEAGEERGWNRTIYGNKGRFHFYVAGARYPATDEEVAEHEKGLAAMIAWDAKYANEIAAFKAAAEGRRYRPQ